MPSQRLPTWSRVPTPMAPVQPEVLVLPEMLARPEVPVRLEALMPPWRPSRHAAAWWWQRPPAASRSLKIESSRAMCGVGAPALPIIGLDVAVNKSAPMCVREREQKLREDLARLGTGQRQLWAGPASALQRCRDVALQRAAADPPAAR